MQESYDVVVVGGGIAGSVAARFAAGHGLSTLLVEKARTPRNKACSGIQFTYFERLLGERIPRHALCANDISRVEMITPGGRVFRGRMHMLNFWRSTFDSWLNQVAAKAGARFSDETRLVDFHEDGGWTRVHIATNEAEKTVRTRYLIGADGMNSVIRKKLRPQDYAPKTTGATLNYYFVGQAELDPNTLYMFYDRDFSPLMFAWVYLKDDQWVVGTGADDNLTEYAGRFLSHIQEKYSLRAELVRKEGFASPLESTVYLGEGRVLMAGDAAGLVDLYRGLGMDNAALSARLAVKAILQAEKKGNPPADTYMRLMERITRRIRRNAGKQMARYATNETLEKSLSPMRVARDGVLMLTAAQVDRLLPAERMIFLPL